MTNWSKNTEPQLPYYALIFVENDLGSFSNKDLTTEHKLVEWQQEEAGYLGCESIRNGNNGIFVSYWKSQQYIDNWKNKVLHQRQKEDELVGRYDLHHTIICKVKSLNVFRRNV